MVESDSVRLRLVSDRSEMHLDVQPNPAEGDEWFGIGLVRRWLLGERPGYDHLDASTVSLLRDHLAAIEAEWSDSAGREAGLGRLSEERAARADDLFGKPPSG